MAQEALAHPVEVGSPGLAEQLDNNPDEAIALPDARFTSKAVREPIGVAGAMAALPLSTHPMHANAAIA